MRKFIAAIRVTETIFVNIEASDEAKAEQMFDGYISELNSNATQYKSYEKDDLISDKEINYTTDYMKRKIAESEWLKEGKGVNTVTPREIAVKTGKPVMVYSSGLACFIGRHSADESKMLRTAKITDEDWDNVYYPDGTSEWERMRERAVSKEIVDCIDEIGFKFTDDVTVEA